MQRKEVDWRKKKRNHVFESGAAFMKQILLVEDELVISRVLKAYLQKEEYQVWQAADGVEAIRMFDEQKPDLVLLDVMLPEISGWEVLQYIRERSACPVIMITALGQTDHKLKGFNQGADDYITKPFVAEEVVARVNAVMRRSVILVKDQETRFFGTEPQPYIFARAVDRAFVGNGLRGERSGRRLGHQKGSQNPAKLAS
jgi:DNA-binding response OmpR family regulator